MEAEALDEVGSEDHWSMVDPWLKIFAVALYQAHRPYCWQLAQTGLIVEVV